MSLCKKSLCPLLRNFIPPFFAELLSFSATEGVLSMNCLFKAMPNHLNWAYCD